MANQPIQLPNIDLPGAEFFSLAPNRTIALQGRRRFTVGTAQISCPAGVATVINEAQATTSTVMEAPFPQTAGVYIHKADLIVTVGDNALELQIVSAALGMRTNNTAGSAKYQIGTPLLTFSTPAGFQEQVALSDRDVLAAQRDIALYSNGLVAQPTVLSAGFVIAVNNLDTSTAHFIQVIARFIYTRLDGLVE